MSAGLFHGEALDLPQRGRWLNFYRRFDGPNVGCCQVNRAKSKAPLPCLKSSNRSRPNGRRIGAKAAKGGSADEMALDVEGVVDRRVGGEESLG